MQKVYLSQEIWKNSIKMLQDTIVKGYETTIPYLSLKENKEEFYETESKVVRVKLEVYQILGKLANEYQDPLDLTTIYSKLYQQVIDKIAVEDRLNNIVSFSSFTTRYTPNKALEFLITLKEAIEEQAKLVVKLDIAEERKPHAQTQLGRFDDLEKLEHWLEEKEMFNIKVNITTLNEWGQTILITYTEEELEE